MTFQNSNNRSEADTYSVVFVDSRTENIDLKLAACRDVFSFYYKKLLDSFFKCLAIEVQTLLRQAAKDERADFTPSLHTLERDKDYLHREYMYRVMNGFDQFWSADATRLVAPGEASIADTAETPSDEDVLAVEQALSVTIQRGEQSSSSELQIINRHFSALAGTASVTDSDNPIGPGRLTRILAELLESLSLHLSVKLAVYRVFERFVLNELGVVYRALTALRDDEPTRSPEAADASDHLSRAKVVNMGSKEAVLQSCTTSGTTSDWDAFGVLRSALAKWRKSQGIPTRESDDGYQYYEILSALTAIQKTYARTIPGDSVLSQRSWLKDALMKELKVSATGDVSRQCGAVEGDAVDLVSLIFENLLGQGAIGRDLLPYFAVLQIPVTKVAILDKSFFSKAEHPVRQFMDQMISAAAEVRLTGNDSDVAKNIRKTIGQLMEGFDLYVGTFTEVHEGFTAFMSKHRHRKRLAEDRAVQLLQSREKLALAKDETARAIAQRVQSKRLPDFLDTFLRDAWKDRLILAYLREDSEPGGWREALALTDNLLETVIPPQTPEEKKKILAILPGVIDGLRAGMKLISYDRHLRSRFFKDLAVCHVVILNSDVLQKSGQDCFNSSQTRLADDTGPGLSGEMETDTDMPSSEAAATIECSDAVLGWRKGQWVEFKELSGEFRRGKLVWISPNTHVGLFVDPLGAKLAEKTAAEFQAALRSGEAAPIDSVDAPDTTGVLSDLMAQLNSPRDGAALEMTGTAAGETCQ